jgi:hypothetical protein
MPKVGGLVLGAIVFLLGMLLLGGVYTAVPARDTTAFAGGTPSAYIVNRFTGRAWEVQGVLKGEVRRP